MDTITHGMIGALAGRAYAPRNDGGLTPTQRGLAGAVAAMLPDVDYVTFWIDPMQFLGSWHRGPSHSVLFVPLWAVLLGITFAWVYGRKDCRRECTLIAALALLSHIASDLITVYGTAVLYPLSDWRPGLGSTMVIDPWLSGIALVGLLLCWRRPEPGMARAAIALMGMYVSGQAALQLEAQRFAGERLDASAPAVPRAFAIAQPLSPLHWRVFVPTENGYQTSTIRLVNATTFPEFAARMLGFGEMLAAYRSRDDAIWEVHSCFGDDPEEAALAREVWDNPLLSAFRKFAAYPALYRIDRSGSQACVWFTDLRFNFPGMVPTFRYGLCRLGEQAPWQPYRLRRYTLNERVAL